MTCKNQHAVALGRLAAGRDPRARRRTAAARENERLGSRRNRTGQLQLSRLLGENRDAAIAAVRYVDAVARRVDC